MKRGTVIRKTQGSSIGGVSEKEKNKSSSAEDRGRALTFPSTTLQTIQFPNDPARPLKAFSQRPSSQARFSTKFIVLGLLGLGLLTSTVKRAPQIGTLQYSFFLTFTLSPTFLILFTFSSPQTFYLDITLPLSFYLPLFCFFLLSSSQYKFVIHPFILYIIFSHKKVVISYSFSYGFLFLFFLHLYFSLIKFCILQNSIFVDGIQFCVLRFYFYFFMTLIVKYYHIAL